MCLFKETEQSLKKIAEKLKNEEKKLQMTSEDINDDDDDMEGKQGSNCFEECCQRAVWKSYFISRWVFFAKATHFGSEPKVVCARTIGGRWPRRLMHNHSEAVKIKIKNWERERESHCTTKRPREVGVLVWLLSYAPRSLSQHRFPFKPLHLWDLRWHGPPYSNTARLACFTQRVMITPTARPSR